jgi:hypothetical protein
MNFMNNELRMHPNRGRTANRTVCHAVVFVVLCCACFESSQGQSPVLFREQVAPLLQEHCVACHGAKRAEGGYRLDTVEQMLRPGDGGNSPVIAMKSADSEIVQRVRSHDLDLRMPADSDPLDPAAIDILARWMDEGAQLEGIPVNEPMWSIIPPITYGPAPEHYPNAFPITSIAFSVDGLQVMTSGYHEILVWNVADGGLARRLGNQVERSSTLLALQQGAMLAIAGGTPGSSGEVRLVDSASGQIQGVLARSNDMVLDVVIRPGKNEMAVALADNTIRLIDLDRNEQRRMIASHADWVTQLAYSDDGKRLGSASRDKSAKVYDAESGDLLVSYPGHAAAVRGIAAIGDGAQWMTVGADNNWHRWEVEGAKKVAELPLGGEPAKLLKSGTMVFAMCSDKRALRIDLDKNAIATQQVGHENWVISAAYHPTSNLLATGSLDGSICLWNAADGALVRSWVARP